MADSASSLTQLRADIDALDGEILRLLARRAQLVVRIGDLKRATGTAVYDPERERDILDRLVRLAPTPLDAEAVRCVFESIIDESRRIEEQHVAPRSDQR